MMRYHKAFLSDPPGRLVVGGGMISAERENWAQPADQWAMFFYLSAGTLTVGTRVYPFAPGSVSIIPPGLRCGHDRVWEGTECKWFSFTLPGRESDVAALPVIVHLAAPQFDGLVERHIDAVKSLDRTTRRTAAFIWDTLWSLSRPPDHLRSSSHLYDAEAYIREHLGEPLKVEAIAAEVSISQTHLLRLFRLEHGATVQQFIRDLRVNEAKRLLLSTSLAIKEIAHRVGFSDSQHFNKVMRWTTGYSPTQLRAGVTLDSQTAMPPSWV